VSLSKTGSDGMTPRLFNTLGRRIEDFTPAHPGRVGLYTCGPTVYNHAHIGNLRTFLFEDILRRSLEYLDYEVHQVMNLTDVDDKTIQGAHAAGLELDEYTAPFIASFFEDLATLRIQPAQEYPRATHHVAEMIEITRQLMAGGHAYEKDGSVFFRIASDEDYGKLSGVDVDQGVQGDRVASDEYGKDDVRDFVLWKAAKLGEPTWESPWGPGRPGWHIECSAMSMKYLGNSFDIHCGGVDNIFPHHDNEIAQSESATGKPFARVWLHAEHLIVEGQKMSKSLGNFYTLKDLLALGKDPRAIRYLLLSVNYRQKLNFTFEAVDAAGAALRRLDEHRFRLQHAIESGEARSGVVELTEGLTSDFGAAVADDLNLSAALAVLFGFIKETNILIESGGLGSGDRQRILAALARVDQVLAVLDPENWVQASTDGPSDEEIQGWVDERDEARRRRDFARSDELRDRLAELSIVLEDTPGGTRWKRG
jgi:cysteinyl-tRNA synthetase